mgnify:CR=1 FL=1
MKRITDPDFVYTNAASTDIKRTFAKARLRLKREAERQRAADTEAQQKVTTIKGRGK